MKERSTEPLEEDEESTCAKPCDLDKACDECASYWRRMQAEGFWDRDRHRWTDKGWKEMTKWP